jgi:CheY-like chemotaxis protein
VRARSRRTPLFAIDCAGNVEVVSSESQYILVIDDDPDFREIAATFLEKNGYRVRCVASAQVALTAFERDPPALVVLDLQMPRMTGWEFLKLKQRRPRLARVPVVIVSAYLDDQPIGERAACVALSKPVDLDRLLTVVALFCARASESRDAKPLEAENSG